MIPFWLRHYAPWVDEIVVYDEDSRDGTREAVMKCPKARLLRWPYRGLNDRQFLASWHGFIKQARGHADWVILADVDELLWHPDPRGVLERAQAEGFSLIPSLGINLVPDAPPVDDGRSQFYELTSFGVHAENYSKALIVNPGMNITYDYGRHGVLEFDGRLCPRVEFKLLHCHFLGVDYTRARNKRNYDATLDKAFAWNYAPLHNEDPWQTGSVAWVERVIRDGLRVNVFA